MRSLTILAALAVVVIGGACATTQETPEQAAANQAKLQAAFEQFRCAGLANSFTGSPQYNEWLATCPHPGVTVVNAPGAPTPSLQLGPQVIQGQQNEVCVYNVNGNVVTRTLPANRICPLNP